MKERIGNFFSYVRFFGFMAVVGIGAYWWYSQRSIGSADTAAGTSARDKAMQQMIASPEQIRLPTDLWKSVFATILPPLLQPLNAEPMSLPANFVQAEQITAQRAAVSGTRQAAWKTAAQIGKEIRETYDSRKQFIKNLTSQRSATTPPVSSIKPSAAQILGEEKRRNFFEQAGAKRWELQAAQKKARIDALYQQLLNQEAQISSS